MATDVMMRPSLLGEGPAARPGPMAPDRRRARLVRAHDPGARRGPRRRGRCEEGSGRSWRPWSRQRPFTPSP